MTVLALVSSEHGSEIAVHPGWLDQAFPEIADEALRKALFDNVRLAARLREAVTRLISEREHCTTDQVDLSEEIAKLAALWGEPLFRRIGILWFAPVLAKDLIIGKRNDDGRFADKAEMRLVLTFRDHSAASCVTHQPKAEDYSEQGKRCIAAWLVSMGNQGVGLRAALRPGLECEDPCAADRVAFMAQCFAEPLALEGLCFDTP